MSKKTSKPELIVGSRRHQIISLSENPEAKYAVFRRSQSGKKAWFQVVHSDIDTAIEAAREHAAETASFGSTDFTFYVVELKCRLGIEGGKLVDTTV
jgi:hypothetical protein